jgi:hypothetical protein
VKPKTLYRVEVVPTPGNRLRYAQRGGQTFSQLGAAQARMQDLKIRCGVETRLWVCTPVWEEVP